MLQVADKCDKSLVCVTTETEKKFCYYIDDAWPIYDPANPLPLAAGSTDYLVELKNSAFFYFDDCGSMNVAV